MHRPQPGICKVTPATELPMCAAKNQDSQNSPHPKAGISTDQGAFQTCPTPHEYREPTQIHGRSLKVKKMHPIFHVLYQEIQNSRRKDFLAHF